MARPRNKTLAQELKPVAKVLLKEAVRAYDTAKKTLTEATERFGDLVAQARAEMTNGKPTKRKPRGKS